MEAALDYALADKVRSATPRALGGWYGLGVIILASVIGSLVGKGLIALVAEPIKRSLDLSDGQLGLINGLALTLVTAIAAVPIGWLADRIDRRWLLAACVLIWSAGSAGFALSATFPMLFGFSMAIAVGEAVLGPITYSMIPDLFPRERWVLANSVMIVGVLLGFYLSMGLAGSLLGYVGAHEALLPAWLGGREPWRATMVLCSLTGPLLALLIMVMRLERHEPVAAGAGGGSSGGDVLRYFRQEGRTLAGIFLGFGISYAAAGALGAWGAVILTRLFGAEPARIGEVLGYGGAIAAITGVGAAVLVVRLLRPRFGDRTPMLVAQLALLLGLIATVPLLFVRSAEQFFAIVLLKTGLLYMATSLSPTVLQLVSPPRMRGRVIAIGGMAMLLCQSLMPWLIGIVSDRVFTGPRGILEAAISVVLPALVIGLVTLGWGSVTLPRTIRTAAADD